MRILNYVRLLRSSRSAVATLAALVLLAALVSAASLKPNPRQPDYQHDRWGTGPVSADDIVFPMTAYLSVFDGPDDDNGDGVADRLGVPHFVAYEIKRYDGRLPPGPERPSSWIWDRALARARIMPKDATYQYSRAFRSSHPNWYVRGHLCMKQHAWRLGADADWNTHTLFNAVPQRQDFNAGIWLDLEDKTAEWADQFGSVWIIAGPVFEPRPNTPREWLGEEIKGEILAAIPDALFKIVVRQSSDPDRPDVLAFIYPQDADARGDGAYDHRRYLVSVAAIERKTGLDFFTSLARSDQRAIEHRAADRLWAD